MKGTLTSFIVCSILTIALASAEVFACNHALLAPDTPVISFADAAAQLEQEYPHISFKKLGSCKCGSSFYSVKSVYNGMLGSINLGEDEYAGNRLLMLAGEILKMPCAQLTAVQRSRYDLFADIKALESEFGVHVYDPSAMPESHRFPDMTMQRLYATVEKLRGTHSYSSSKNISMNLLVRVTGVVSGRDNYDPETIYQSGDLRAAFLADNELFNKYKEFALANQKSGFCQYSLHDWEKIIAHLDELGLLGDNSFT